MLQIVHTIEKITVQAVGAAHTASDVQAASYNSAPFKFNHRCDIRKAPEHGHVLVILSVFTTVDDVETDIVNTQVWSLKSSET